MKYTDRWNT